MIDNVGNDLITPHIHTLRGVGGGICTILVKSGVNWIQKSKLLDKLLLNIEVIEHGANEQNL